MKRLTARRRDDREQSRLIVDKLKARGIHVACHEDAGEGQASASPRSIVAVLEAELALLRRAMRMQ